MKNYDEERAKLDLRERTFTLCGREFVAGPIMPARALSDLADLQTGAQSSRLYDTLVEVIVATLRPDSRKPFEDLMNEDLDLPIDFDTLLAIANDLAQLAAGRPTSPPSPSSSTPERTPTVLTDGYGSPAVAASTISPSVPV